MCPSTSFYGVSDIFDRWWRRFLRREEERYGAVCCANRDQLLYHPNPNPSAESNGILKLDIPV